MALWCAGCEASVGRRQERKAAGNGRAVPALVIGPGLRMYIEHRALRVLEGRGELGVVHAGRWSGEMVGGAMKCSWAARLCTGPGWAGSSGGLGASAAADGRRAALGQRADDKLLGHCLCSRQRRVHHAELGRAVLAAAAQQGLGAACGSNEGQVSEWAGRGAAGGGAAAAAAAAGSGSGSGTGSGSAATAALGARLGAACS